MKIKLIALAILASAASGMAHAQLNDSDLAEIDTYQQTRPNVRADIINEMRNFQNVDSLHSYMARVDTAFGYSNLHDGSPAAPTDHADHLRGLIYEKANQARTTQQTEALQAAYRTEFAKLKGNALVKANVDRTAQQKEALQDSYRTEFAKLKGDALVKANQERTAEQAKALNAAILDNKFGLVKANKERTQMQTDALHTAQTQAESEKAAHLRGLIYEKANQARTAQQTEALQDAYRTEFHKLKGEALVKANQERTAEESNALELAEGEARQKANQARTEQQNKALEDAKTGAALVSNYQAHAQQQTSALVAAKNNSLLEQRMNAATQSTETNRQALAATNHRVADNSAAIADHEQRIETLEASNSASFGKLKNQVDENRQRASAAISGVAAMANIPQVIQGQTFSVGAGVGTTDSESALAVGFSARATEHVVVKASVSDDTQQNFVVGGGVSYGW